MKKLKKSLMKATTFIVIALLIVGIFAGCDAGSTATEAADTDSISETDTKTTAEAVSEKEPVTLTMWYPMWDVQAEMFTNMNENLGYVELEKRTGVHIEFIHPPVAENETAYMVLIASKNLPDIVMHDYGVDYPGGPDKAIEDEVYLRLNELIDQYALNYKALIESDSEVTKQTRTDMGNIWCFSMIDDRAQEAYFGPVYRKDWLDKLDMSVPETMDELHTVLQAFKDELGAETPMLLDKTGIEESDFSLVSAFDVNNTFYNENGTIKYGPVQDGYKQYLTMMNKWYEEGLIDPEFPTKTELDPDITNGRGGMWNDGFWTFDTWQQKAVDPDFEMVGGPYPSLVEGEPVHFRQQNFRVQHGNTAITTACDTPEVAVEWIDYKFSDEGFILCNYGIEGEMFTYDENNEPQYTDFMANNPDGLSYYTCQYKYLVGQGSYLRKWDREMFSYPDAAVEATFTWHNSSDGEYFIPPFLTMTPEEGESFNAIMGDIKTFVSEMTVRFIIGEEPLENFDKYVETIQSMNLEEALSIKTATWERYLVR